MVYHGKESWAFIEPFVSYFSDIDDDFIDFLPISEFILTNIPGYPDSVIQTFQTRFLRKIFTAFKHHWDKAYLKRHFAELWLLNYKNYETDETDFFIHAFGLYLSAITGGVSNEEIRQQLIKIKSKTSNSEDMVATERFLAELKKEGHLIGRQEGRQEAEEILVLNIYKKTGWTAHQISDITDLTPDYIQSVIDKFEEKNT